MHNKKKICLNITAGKHKEISEVVLLLQCCKVFNIHWKSLSPTVTQDPHFHSRDRDEIRAIWKIKMLFCVKEMWEWQCNQEVSQSGGQGLESERATNFCEVHTLLVVLIDNFKAES